MCDVLHHVIIIEAFMAESRTSSKIRSLTLKHSDKIVMEEGFFASNMNKESYLRFYQKSVFWPSVAL